MVVIVSGRPSFRHSLRVACLILIPLGVFLFFAIEPTFVFYLNAVPLQIPDDGLDKFLFASASYRLKEK